MRIPKIIHQIWDDIYEPLPPLFKEFGDTWKRDYPDFEYRLWSNEKMTSFVQKFYPQYWEKYLLLPYNIQRWDAIRYLILDKIGGIYIDFDYESIKPMNHLFNNRNCCFSSETETHCFIFRKPIMFNNALMMSIPKHPFIRKIIKSIFEQEIILDRKNMTDDEMKFVIGGNASGGCKGSGGYGSQQSCSGSCTHGDGSSGKCGRHSSELMCRCI